MARLKPLLVICWIAFGLGLAMHWPLADLTHDFCSWVAAATLHEPGDPAPTESSAAVAARPRCSRAAHPLVRVTTGSGLPRAQHRPAVPAIQLCKPDGGISFLLQSWQFCRRTALAPRAPSSLA